MTILKTLAAAAVALSVAGPAAAEKIIVVAHGQANDPFWSVVKNGVEEAGKDTGAKVDYRAPETFDMVAMGQLIDAAVNQKPDGLVVSIPDADALGPSIKRAVAAGIPVISMNSGSDVVARSSARCCMSARTSSTPARPPARSLPKWAARRRICVNQEVGNVSLDLRCEGFKEGFGGKVTRSSRPTMIRPKSKSKVRAALESDTDVDTVLGARRCHRRRTGRRGRTGPRSQRQVNVATFDLSAGFLKDVADGKAAFAIDQQQFLQGYLPVAFLALNAKYGLMPGGDVPSGPNLITKDKAAKVIDLSAKGIR